VRTILSAGKGKLLPLLLGGLGIGSHGALLAQVPTTTTSVEANSLELLEQEQNAFRAAVTIAQSSVVQIETFGGLERIGAELVADGPTTGLIVSQDGWIVSSLFSFRAQPASILVSLPNGKRAAAKIVSRDFSRELVLLKIDDVTDLPVPTVCPIKEVRVGQWSIAIGKTYDKNSVSQSAGIISALGRVYEKAIQSDAKISPVNYGGPLIDLEGRVIGILAPISPGAFLEGDSSQLYDSGIGFAIPLQDVLDRLPKLQKGENIHPGKLGIVATDQNEMAGPVRIAGATPGSPAAKAGVRAKDQLVEVNGRPISMLAQLRHALGPTDAGSNIQFAVLRQGKRIEMQCTLAEDIPIYRQRYLGLRVKETSGRVEITRVEDASPAKTAGLKVGDVVQSIDNEPITSRRDLRRMIAVAELDKPLKFAVENGGAQRDVTITAVVWPKPLPLDLPQPFAGVDDSMVCEVVDLTLGDFPNKAFAVVPPQATSRELGVLVLFPEPGEVDRTKIQQRFTEFSRDQGWIVAVIPSRNATEWTREEVELAGRSIGRLENAYKLDPMRLVIGGIGIGGRLAIGAAAMDRQRIVGALVIGTQVNNLGLKSENSPLQSLQFLFVGKQDELQDPVNRIEANGFSANIIPMNELTPGKWEMIPLEPITRWLEGLGRL
jgi:serine protease Do